MLVNYFTLSITFLLYSLVYPKTFYNSSADIIHQKPSITINETAQSSKLINKKWKLVYNSGRDRTPAEVPDSIMFITEFFPNNKYIQVIHSDTITTGEWHVSPSTSELHLKYRFKKGRKNSKDFKVMELTDSTLVLSFTVWFGDAQQRFKALN